MKYLNDVTPEAQRGLQTLMFPFNLNNTKEDAGRSIPICFGSLIKIFPDVF